MTDSGLGLRSLSQDIGATFGRQLAAALLGLLITASIARFYGPEGNGAYAVALLLPTMLATFLNLGVTSANVYYLGSAQINIHTLLGVNLRIYLLLVTTGLGIGSLILLWKGEHFFPGVSPPVLWLALAGFPVALLQGFLTSFFQGLQQFRSYNLVLIAQPLLFLVLVGGLIVSGVREILFLIIVYLISQLFVLAFTIKRIRLQLRPEEEREGPLGKFFRQILNYGWKAHLGNILTFINYKADILLTNFFIGPAAAGIYVIAVALAEGLWLVSQAVSTVMFPRLSQLSSDEDKRKRLTPLVTRWVLILTLVGALLLSVVAGQLIEMVFGKDYADALLPLWILLPGIVLASASRVIANDIAARGRPDLNMYALAFVVFLNVVGNLILIPIWGLAGAAIATTTSYTLNMILCLAIYTRFTANCWMDTLFVKPSDIRMFIAAIQRH